MTLVRPRLTDHHGILVAQESIDFAIPFLDEDIPLYVDPFLLWKSPSMQETSLHVALISAFNGIGRLATGGRVREARRILIDLSECTEAGLGQARNRIGRRISEAKADEIISLFESIPDIQAQGLQHLEAVQLLVDGIAKDRISDFTCSLLKSFLIDFTIHNCKNIGIPTERVTIENLYDSASRQMASEVVDLPVNPETKAPILLIPKRWLRFMPWINYDGFYDNAYLKLPAGVAPERPERVDVLSFNRHNFGVVKAYLDSRQKVAADCHNDPLFRQIPVTSAKAKWAAIRKLPPGTGDAADKKYEGYIEQLLASLLYPQLDFAQGQSRTDSGAHIRDLIFYNNRGVDFLEEIHEKYGCSQIVFEMKNVREIQREHVNQLNRYLVDHFGRLAIFVTRNPLPKSIRKNIVDLWSAHRKCILALTDDDLQTMVTVFESKQRLPIEVLKRAYVDFTRSCPS
ncbi:MAG TPA: hypothetical protein VGS22_04665 [Thermoanaerobaculia bacterium]|jgi:hypothetical protein|nr:hypothetical protein [Thermoanaerobaculia bacterium]